MDKKIEEELKIDEENDICFIITPIGGDNTDVRRKAEGVIEAVIKPVLESEEFKYEVIVAHEINETGSIPDQVFDHVVNAKLIIANVTGLNPNVMYELGVRHALRLPVITIAETGTQLPFDINSQRTIFYENDMFGTKELKFKLKEMVKKIDFSKENHDNPVMNALRKSEIFSNINKEDKEQQLLLEIYDSIKKIEYDKNKQFNNKQFNNKKISEEVITFIKIDPKSGEILDIDKGDEFNIDLILASANVTPNWIMLNKRDIKVSIVDENYINLRELYKNIEFAIKELGNEYSIVPF